LYSLFSLPYQTYMDALVAGPDWPTKAGTYNGIPIPAPTRQIGFLTTNTAGMNFNWTPGTAWNSPGSPMAMVDAYGAAVSNFTNQNAIIDEKLLWTDYLARNCQNRFYFAPGYTTAQGTDIGPRLPMQASYDQTDNKWQAAYLGKNTLDWRTTATALGAGRDVYFHQEATYEVFWLIFFSFREFVDGVAGFTTSEAHVENHYLAGKTNAESMLDTAVNTEAGEYSDWVKNSNILDTLKTAITSTLNINVPSTAQINNGSCFFNNEGDLIATYSYG